MKRMITGALVVLWFCPWAYAAPASMSVHVAVGKVSEVVFPEKVAKVIKGGAADSVLVEVLDNSVYVLPKTNTPADIFVTGVSGKSYPLDLVIAAQHDIRVEVSGQNLRRISREINLNAMDLMKEILRGVEPAGATVLKNSKSMALNGGQIKMTVEVIYDFPHIAAYIFKAQNLSDNSVIVPVQQISFLNLLAVTSDQDMLKPKGEEGDNTKVYIVAGK
ncbi:MAG: hypothetical protein HY591_04780 [Candidatus Omnitrophica bacterium]|nr:hypothetical protein [Candidatus Omnitrophota bacterium]